MDPLTGLPTRSRLVSAIDEMISEGDEPAVFVVSVNGFGTEDLESDPAIGRAFREVASRLSRLVRGDDVLASPSPGVFALAGSGIEAADTEILVERIRSAFALPTELGGDVVALSVTVGFTHADSNLDGLGLVEAAESDLTRRAGS